MDCVVPIAATPLKASSPSIPNTGGTLSTLLSIFRHEGYPGLYAGLRPTLVMSVPNTVLYFAGYDEISLRLRRHHAALLDRGPAAPEAHREDARRQAYIPLVAGAAARLLASLATAPFELIRTRQAGVAVTVARPPGARAAPGLREELRSLVRTHGASALYVGLAPTLWRDVPFSALYWLFLERFRDALAASDGRGTATPPGVRVTHAFVSGAAAGSIAAAFTT